MSDSTTALLILAAVIGLFMWNRLPVAVVALSTAVTLWATDLLDLDQAFAGFGDPVIVFIASLFVVSEAIDVTGITTWAGSKVLEIAGTGTTKLLGSIMLLCAVMTALISLNGSVAALLPMVVVIGLQTKRPASRLLMPMVYAGSAGALLVLAGSPVNIIVSDAAEGAGADGFGYFEFAWVGVPILLATMALGLLLAPRVVPEREPESGPRDLSRHAAVLASHYSLADGFYRLRVRDQSPLVGAATPAIDVSAYHGVRVIAVQAHGDVPAPAVGDVGIDDVLVVAGPTDEVSRLAVEQVLAVAMTPLPQDRPDQLVNREVGLCEVVVPPRSPLVGEPFFPGMVRTGDLVVLAIKRYGKELAESTVDLRDGNSLLLYGSWTALEQLINDRDVIVVDSPDLVRRQVPLGPRAIEAGVVLAAMVVVLALGVVPPAIAGALAAIAIVLTKVLTVQQAVRAVQWQVVILVGGLIPLSTAIQDSGAGEKIADVVVDVVGADRPMLLMTAVFVLTTVLGLVLSNTATVLIVLPIALATAAEGGINVQPMLMLLAVAASAALLTPVQTPANMMIMSPGGYRFGDYWKLGLPVLLVWMTISLLVIPRVWPLTG